MGAEFLMLLSGSVAFVLTVFWVRSRDIREKYALIWLLLSFALLILGIFPQTVLRLADYCRLSYVALVLFVCLVLSYVFAFFVSVALTRQYRRGARLAQELALTRERLSRIEEILAEKADRSPPNDA